LPTRSNLWLGFLVGVSGLLIGFAVSTLAYRYRVLRVPGQSIVERMSRDLQLTPAQRDRVGDILRESRFKVREQQLDYQKHRHQIFWQALSQVREMLTPEQQKIFDREFSRPWMMRSGGHEHGDHDHGGADDFAEPMQTPPPK
jgi:Spy/CpxP family protein refolding chaperone